MTEEGRRITRRAGVVGAGILLSRAAGFVRDAVIAALFPKRLTDAFFVAFTIPNTLRALLAEGALSAGYLPVFVETMKTQGRDGARRFVAAALGTVTVVLVAVTALGIALAPLLVHAYASGFQADAEKFALTVRLTRWLFPYLAFMGVGAVAMAVLNALDRFFAPAFAPTLLNVAFIACAFALPPLLGRFGIAAIYALAAGALLGGLLQVAVQFPALGREGMLPWPRVDFGHPGVRRVGKLLVPMLLGTAVYQVNILLSRAFASSLPEGSVTYLYYAQRLVELPQGLVANAIATATLPALASLKAHGHDAEFRSTYAYGVRLTLFVALPASALFVVLAVPICAVLFQRGAFDVTMTQATAAALVWMGGASWIVAWVRQTVPAFYACSDTRSPVLAAAADLVVFIALCLVLRGPFLHVGIAMATGGSAFVRLALLVVLLRRKVGPLGLRATGTTLLRTLGATAALCLVAFAVARYGDWTAGGNSARNIVVLAAAIAGGFGAFVLTAAVVGSKELSETWIALSRRG